MACYGESLLTGLSSSLLAGAFPHDAIDCSALPWVPIANKYRFKYLNHSARACGAGATTRAHCQFHAHEKADTLRYRHKRILLINATIIPEGSQYRQHQLTGV